VYDAIYPYNTKHYGVGMGMDGGDIELSA